MYPIPEPVYSENQECAGKNCINEGKRQLTIVFLNKAGWFCQSCERELLKHNLIAEHEKEDSLN